MEFGNCSIILWKEESQGKIKFCLKEEFKHAGPWGVAFPAVVADVTEESGRHI